MEPFAIHYAIKITGGDLPQPVTIPSTFYESLEGTTYINLAKRNPHTETLLLSGTDDKCKSRRLAQTDIIEQLMQLRYDKVVAMVVGSDSDDEADARQAGNASSKTISAMKLKFNKHKLPDTFVVKAPRVGDVSGIEMRMKTSHSRKSALLVEFTPNNVAYLRAACKHQYETEEIRNPSNASKGKKRKIVHDEEEEAEENDEHDEEHEDVEEDEHVEEAALATDLGGQSSNNMHSVSKKQLSIFDSFKQKG